MTDPAWKGPAPGSPLDRLLRVAAPRPRLPEPSRTPAPPVPPPTRPLSPSAPECVPTPGAGVMDSPSGATPNAKPPFVMVGLGLLVIAGVVVVCWRSTEREPAANVAAAGLSTAASGIRNDPGPLATPPAETSPPPIPSAPTSGSPRRGDRLTPIQVAASSYYRRRGEGHPPEHAFDGNIRTAWNDGVEGSGQGQWIEATFDGARRFRRVHFSTGYDHVSPRHGDLFYLNAHMSQASIEIDRREILRVSVGFDQRSAVVDLEATGTSLRIVATNVFAGGQWQDVCVSEVVIEGYAASGAAPASPVAPTSVVAPSTQCMLVLSSNFHLRPTAARSRGHGRSYSSGESVEVLAPTDVYRRGDQRLYYVRVASDGRRGYVFLLPSQRARCGL
jgi:hypothetical protein